MSQIFIHLSNIHNSSISFGGECHSQYGENNYHIFDLLLQALEINRQLVSGITSQLESEVELCLLLKRLIAEHKALELKVSHLLNP